MIRKQHAKIVIALAILALCLFESKFFDKKSSSPATRKAVLSSQLLNHLWNNKDLEVPDRPSTRTGFSSRRFEQLETWVTFQERLKNKISRVRDVNILFYGDSITESLEGTSYGSPCATDRGRCQDIPEMFRSIKRKYSITSHVSAISGDRTQHLLWRLTEGGELPDKIRPDVVVVLIGTNNIAQNSVQSIALGIQDVVDILYKKLPNATILVNEVFPRYDDMVVTINKAKSVDTLNALLKDAFVNRLSSHYGEHGVESIKYLQCGNLFRPTSQQYEYDKNISVNVDLMPDKLHPNAVGMEKWLTECVLPVAMTAIGK